MGYKRNKREEGQPSAKGQHIPNLAPDVGFDLQFSQGLARDILAITRLPHGTKRSVFPLPILSGVTWSTNPNSTARTPGEGLMTYPTT